MSIATQEGVSIIIPVYNYAEFVAEAIDSALNQTYPNIEVVVIDDGSTDDTPHVLERYSGFARIITQDNLGLSAARNLGLREASNDLVAFLDADDRLLPNMVALLHGTLSLTGGDCALAAGSHSYIDASSRSRRRARPKRPISRATNSSFTATSLPAPFSPRSRPSLPSAASARTIPAARTASSGSASPSAAASCKCRTFSPRSASTSAT
jgi:glycosyltransferase involved in cell wall biosynthesis